MKKAKFSLAFLLLAALIIPLVSSAQSLIQNQKDIDYGNSLIRVFSNGKVGYIDTTGKIIIEPKFANAFDFSEGLAPARLNGKFGLIDIKGNFVIEPKYDYIERFPNGVYVFFSEGKAGFLNRRFSYEINKIILPNYSSIKFFSDTKAFATTFSGKHGIIDYHGNIIFDTTCSDIYFVSDKYVIAEKHIFNRFNESMPYSEISIIDTSGTIILPFETTEGLFCDDGKNIIMFGYDSAKKSNRNKVIASNGNVTDMDFLLKKYSAINDTTPKLNKTISKRIINDSLLYLSYFYLSKPLIENSFIGIFNCHTNELIKNKNWSNVSAVGDSSIFVTNYINYEGLINSKGEVINNLSSENFKINLSEDRKLISAFTDSVCSIYDINGNFIKSIPLNFPAKIKKHSGKYYLYTSVTDPVKQNKYNREIFGMDNYFHWKTYEDNYRYEINSSGFVTSFNTDSFYCYNNRGNLIYKSVLYKPGDALNIDYMKAPDTYPGRLYQKSFNPDYNKFGVRDDRLSIFINEDTDTTYNNLYRGYALYIVNKSPYQVNIGLNYSIEMKLQAKDANGKWRDINDKDKSILCGTGLESEILGQYDFTVSVIPAFEGELQTVMRAVLTYPHPKFKGGTLTIYSNEVKCGINPAQFWRRPDEQKSNVPFPFY
jgi:hypothetical protein